ncbi:MAG: fatty acid desaturase [Limisphaerales bacterium]
MTPMSNLEVLAEMHGQDAAVLAQISRSDENEGTHIYRSYRATLLSSQRLKELSKLRPSRAVLDAIWMWTGIFLGWALVMWQPAWWSVLLAIPLIGTRYYGLFIIGHDGMHRRVFNNTRTNDLFCDLCIFGPIGTITRLNNRNHLEHHQHLATELDPDRHKHACFNKSTRAELTAFLSGLMSLYPAVRNVFFGKKKRKRADSGAANTSYLFRDFAIIAGWQLALIVGLTWAIGWWAYPVLWLLPVYLHAYLADLVRSFLEHAHPESDAKADEHRLTTFLSNPVERIFFAPMNMNYHAAHHLWTSIPYYNLPAADWEIRKHPASAGLEWRGSYVAFLLRYYLALPLPECRRANVG